MGRAEKILIVDDSATVRQVLRLMLEDAKYHVQAAASGREAMDAAAGERFDLVLLDKNLDGEDGFEVWRALHPALPEAVCILITADQTLESAIQAVDEDIFAYLTKPLQKQDVLFRVERALDRVRLTREREEARAEMQEAKEALEKRTAQLEQTLKQLLRTQTRLAESEKLVSMGMLAAGVAHEINNPTCFILPNLEYLKRSARNLATLAGPEESRQEKAKAEMQHVERMVDRCLEGVTRIQKVVGTLQLFSRRDPGEDARVDLNALCQSFLDVVAHELDERAQLTTQLGEIPAVRGRQRELAQALLNLLLNARRSVFAGDPQKDHRITLSTELRGTEVALTVCDTGPAMVKNESSGPVEGLFLDQQPESGPGLSLSLVRDILDRHQGRLEIASDNVGNCLVAYLPVADPVAQQASPTPPLGR